MGAKPISWPRLEEKHQANVKHADSKRFSIHQFL